jgi:hypothetical protein
MPHDHEPRPRATTTSHDHEPRAPLGCAVGPPRRASPHQVSGQ